MYQSTEAASVGGVFNHLSYLECTARSSRSRVKQLKAKVEALTARRDQLKTEIETHKRFQSMRLPVDAQQADNDEEEEMETGVKNSKLLRLMMRHSELTDHMRAHSLIGGYNAVKTRQGKGMRVTLLTAYEDLYLDTFNLEIDLKPKFNIGLHNIPPFIPLSSLINQCNIQSDVKAFLDTLSQHLNGFVGRRQQLKLVKEQHKSVDVMESNLLCSRIVLMLTLPDNETDVRCTLEYERTCCLPTRVKFDCEDKHLCDTPQWKKSCSCLMETPVHSALSAMKNTGIIA